MKLVEFTRDMRPHKAGETRVVPDSMAADLETEGTAKIVPSVFDNQPPLPADQPKPRGRYFTRKRG